MLFTKTRVLLVALLVASGWLFCWQAVAEDAGAAGALRIGWASADITPDQPVVLTGFSSARVSTGVMDPITATALVLESAEGGAAAERVVLVSVDLISISNELQDQVRELAAEKVPELESHRIVLNATHTHAAPEHRTAPDLAEKFGELGIDIPLEWSRWGMDLGVMAPGDYVAFAAGQIAGAIQQAWQNRAPGGVSFGLAHAVIGHNRLTSYFDGSSRMYGPTERANFSHIEGFEDHSLELLYTWDAQGQLTGVMINAAVPSQVSGGSRITADFWHETRNELRQRLGDELYLLPQCAAAGDQSPRVMINHRGEARMERLTGRSRRQMIAVRIADAVTSILPTMQAHIHWSPVLAHRREHVPLSRRMLSEADIREPRPTHHRPQNESVEQGFARLLAEYVKLRQEIEENPELKEKSGWFNNITGVYWRLGRASRVLDRYELQQTEPKMPVEVHVIRLGDMAMATNPFELYLDFGMQLTTRSPAVQTFVVQLAGGGSGYLPTQRSVEGGAYGAIPESTAIGPQGGRELVEQTLTLIASLWDDD